MLVVLAAAIMRVCRVVCLGCRIILSAHCVLGETNFGDVWLKIAELDICRLNYRYTSIPK